MTALAALRQVLGHDRAVMAAAMALATAAAGGFVLAGGGTGMSAVGMSAATGPLGALLATVPDMIRPEVWTPLYALVIFVMWWLMMVAMMVPSAAPTVLLYGALHPQRGVAGMGAFLLGYLAVWAGFSLVATAAQGGLAAVGMISPMYMTLAVPWLGASLLIAAGLYGLTAMKAVCLDHCRGPVAALTRHRRTGRWAAFRMGAQHGGCCLGCCWALMALLFVGGIMNLWWIIAMMALVAIEKLAPQGPWVSRALAVVLLGLGLVWMAALWWAGPGLFL